VDERDHVHVLYPHRKGHHRQKGEDQAGDVPWLTEVKAGSIDLLQGGDQVAEKAPDVVI
jgi:hypothetical protein